MYVWGIIMAKPGFRGFLQEAVEPTALYRDYPLGLLFAAILVGGAMYLGLLPRFPDIASPTPAKATEQPAKATVKPVKRFADNTNQNIR